MSEHHVSAHATPDDDYSATAPAAGYEHTDARIGAIGTFLLWLTIMVVAVHALMGGLFTFLTWQHTETSASRYPLAVSQGPRLPPEPRLQRHPQADILKLRLEEAALLSSYGWVDRATGTVRIPIEEGMRLAVERGLRARPGATDAGAADAGSADLGAAGAMPSDASAGRRLERRKQ